jgi:STE24 endopeptidase
MANALADFTPAEVERARRYHRPVYAALLAETALGLGLLSVLAFGPAGDHVYGWLDGLPWWGRAVAFPAVVVVLATAVQLPLSFWRGYVHELRFGLSTQTAPGWLADRTKALGVGVVLSAVVLFALVAVARAFPGAWPAIVAPGAAAFVVVMGFVSPVILEPVFNRFRRLDDEDLAGELRDLADRAGVPVRDVLVADASRRTRRENAYVSGIGRTRRVVLYDTLLERAGRDELRLVTAHELAHRRERHTVKGTAIAAAGSAAAMVVVWGLLSSDSVLAAIGATGAGDPRVVPFVLLVAGALEIVSLPLVAALSRRWERIADRFSLDLTGDATAFVTAHAGLARANLADLDPPRAVYVLLFTHPTQPERLAAARDWGAVRSGSRSSAPKASTGGMRPS